MHRPVMVITTRVIRTQPRGIHHLQDSQKVIDYGNSSDRKWLANHCFWAMHNARKVETFPVEQCATATTESQFWQQETAES